MSNTIPATQGTDTAAVPRINVRVLSPGGAGVPESMHIRDVPSSVTLAALKDRITHLAPSRPRPDQQRLIYMGHVLRDSTATLETIFRTQLNTNERDFTLHLIVSQPATSAGDPQTAASSIPQQHGASPLPNQPAAPSLPALQPAPQPNNLPLHRPHGLPQMPLPFPVHPGAPPGMVPIPAHLMPANWQAMQHQANPFGPTPHQQPNFGFPHPTPEQILAHHQALRAANRQQGVGPGNQPAPVNSNRLDGDASQTPNDGAPTQNPQTNGTDQQNAPQVRPPQQPAGPNGLRYQMTINQATFAVPMHQAMQMPGFPHPFPQPAMPQHNQAAMPHNAQPPTLDARAGMTDQGPGEQPMVGPNAVPAQPPQTATSTPSFHNAQGLSGPSGGFVGQQAPNRGPFSYPGPILPAVARPSQPFDTSLPTIYLLSSPNGPHAVLFTQQGAYASNAVSGSSSQSGHIPTSLPHLVRGVQETARHPVQVAGGNQQQRAQDQQQQQQQPLAQLAQQLQEAAQDPQQAQANAQENDVLAPFQAILGHMWLLLRVLIFAYFFLGSGHGWRRPVILAVICIAFFTLRGVLAGAGARDAVRGWWEGVVGIPAGQREGQAPVQGDAAAQQPAVANAAPANVEAVIPAQQQEGVPAVPPAAGREQAGHGAPAQQQDEDLSLWRARFRPVERVLALFVASLWPGIGERTVQARRDEDERQNRLRNEAEVQAQQLRIEQERSETSNVASQEASTQDASADGTSAEQTSATSVQGEDAQSKAAVTGADTRPGPSDNLRERGRGAEGEHEGVREASSPQEESSKDV